MRKVAKFFWRVASAIVAAFGVAGVPDNFRAWAAWLEWLGVEFDNHGLLRIFLALIGVISLWISIALSYRKKASHIGAYPASRHDSDSVPKTTRGGDDNSKPTSVRGGLAGDETGEKGTIKKLIAESLAIEQDNTPFPSLMALKGRKWAYKVKAAFIENNEITRVADGVIDRLPDAYSAWGLSENISASTIRKTIRELRSELGKKLSE